MAYDPPEGYEYDSYDDTPPGYGRTDKDEEDYEVLARLDGRVEATERGRDSAAAHGIRQKGAVVTRDRRLLGRLGEYTFFIEELEHKGRVETVYSFKVEGVDTGMSVLYSTLDEAMVQAVSTKYTGPQMAGGGGVDTAAGWFLRSVGALPNGYAGGADQ